MCSKVSGEKEKDENREELSKELHRGKSQTIAGKEPHDQLRE